AVLAARAAGRAARDGQARGELACLGELVGYGPRPNERCATIGERADVCLAGNHDRAVRGTIDLEEFHGEAGVAATWTRVVLERQWKELLDGLEPEGSAHGVALYHGSARSEEHTSELQSRSDIVCRLLLEKKNCRHLE